MTYIVESNFINQWYVRPWSEKHIHVLCPREEIVQSSIVRNLIASDENIDWYSFNYEEDSFSIVWCPHPQTWKVGTKTINASGAFLMTDMPRMIHSLRGLLKKPNYNRIYKWLLRFGNVMFAMTVPVLCEADTPDTTYFISNSHPGRYTMIDPPVPLEIADHEGAGEETSEMDANMQNILFQQLNGQGYTIGNGLTLILALTRERLLRQKMVADALSTLYYQATAESFDGPLFPTVPEDAWMNLITGHPTPHIADWPQIYGAMGKNCLSDSLLKYLVVMDPEQTSPPEVDYENWVVQIFTPSTASLSSLVSATLHHRPVAASAHWPKWIHQVNVFEEEDEEDRNIITPDIAGYLFGVIRTPAARKWWTNIGVHTMPHQILSIYDSCSHNCLENVITVLCYYYTFADNYTPSLPRRFIRQMWQDIISIYDPDKKKMPIVIMQIILRDILNRHVKEKRDIKKANVHVPYIFIKDFFETYRKEAQLYKTRHSYIITSHADILKEIFTDGNIMDDGIRIHTTMLECLRLSHPDSIFYDFYESWLKKRMTDRLLCIYSGFGLFDGDGHQASGLQKRPQFRNISLYIVGKLLMNHIEENDRDALWV